MLRTTRKIFTHNFHLNAYILRKNCCVCVRVRGTLNRTDFKGKSTGFFPKLSLKINFTNELNVTPRYLKSKTVSSTQFAIIRNKLCSHQMSFSFHIITLGSLLYYTRTTYFLYKENNTQAYCHCFIFICMADIDRDKKRVLLDLLRRLDNGIVYSLLNFLLLTIGIFFFFSSSYSSSLRCRYEAFLLFLNKDITYFRF